MWLYSSTYQIPHTLCSDQLPVPVSASGSSPVYGCPPRGSCIAGRQDHSGTSILLLGTPSFPGSYRKCRTKQPWQISLVSTEEAVLAALGMRREAYSQLEAESNEFFWILTCIHINAKAFISIEPKGHLSQYIPCWSRASNSRNSISACAAAWAN